MSSQNVPFPRGSKVEIVHITQEDRLESIRCGSTGTVLGVASQGVRSPLLDVALNIRGQNIVHPFFPDQLRPAYGDSNVHSKETKT